MASTVAEVMVATLRTSGVQRVYGRSCLRECSVYCEMAGVA